MRTSKVLSITMPPAMARQAERLAQKENRSMSELMREAFRRYQQPAAAPTTTMDMREYVRMITPPDAAFRAIREEAKRKGTAKLTMREIDREIRAARRDRTRKTTNKPAK
jgi:metal-responsive CopG/Arc/MetJ family transcriptional regulator